MATTTRQLANLISVGPAMLRDFELLGIRSVAQLAKQDPQRMYARLNRATGQRQDRACSTRSVPRWRKRGTRGCRRKNACGGIGAGRESWQLTVDSKQRKEEER